MNRQRRMHVAVCVSVASLLVLCGHAAAAGFNPQPEPPGMPDWWTVQGYIDMLAEAVDPAGGEMPFGIDQDIVGDAIVDFSAGIIARFHAPTVADSRPADGEYDVELEYFMVQIGDTIWDQTMPGNTMFQVSDGLVTGWAGIYTDTMPEHPDLSSAFPASPGTWVAIDEREVANFGVVTGTYSLRDGIVSTTTPGDTDGDGDVDLDDFVILKTCFGLICGDPDWNACARADLDNDCDVDLDDFVILKNNFGTAAPSTSSGQAVPEPASLLLLALGGLAAARR